MTFTMHWHMLINNTKKSISHNFLCTINSTCTVFLSNPLTKNKEASARLVNSLVHALNEKPMQDTEGRIIGNAHFLPRFIVVIPDWDLVKHIGHYKFGISIIAEKLLKWIVSAMERAVKTRRDDLARIKKGAVIASEPKIVWVKMIDQPGCFDKALAIQSKFNTILENILADFTNHYIVDLTTKL